jgi:hypothetical protein
MLAQPRQPLAVGKQFLCLHQLPPGLDHVAGDLFGLAANAGL